MNKVTELTANGKLLLTGEYLVLVGAKALAMPVRFGQKLSVREIPGGVIDWVSLRGRKAWFTASFDPAGFQVISADKKGIALDLKKILLAARKLAPGFLCSGRGIKVTITANYPLEWGMGSSATLVYLIAKWAGIPEFKLYRAVSKGSGYDIACAGTNRPIFYQLKRGHPEILPANPGNALRNTTYFVFQGRKQDTGREVVEFLERLNYSEIDLVTVSQLSDSICNAGTAEELIRCVSEHEYLLSTILKKEPVATRFAGFPGAVKSLGAWGGDFAMFVSALDPAEAVAHLGRLGFKKVFRYSDLELAI
jgi:mevalonate kinase